MYLTVFLKGEKKSEWWRSFWSIFKPLTTWCKYTDIFNFTHIVQLTNSIKNKLKKFPLDHPLRPRLSTYCIWLIGSWQHVEKLLGLWSTYVAAQAAKHHCSSTTDVKKQHPGGFPLTKANTKAPPYSDFWFSLITLIGYVFRDFKLWV